MKRTGKVIFPVFLYTNIHDANILMHTNYMNTIRIIKIYNSKFKIYHSKLPPGLIHSCKVVAEIT